MNRRRLAVFIGVIVSIAAAVFMLWPSGSADQHIEETREEAELPEGLVLLGAEQIEASQIEVETVGQGSAVELVFPATVAASPTASARIDARAAGVVRSVGKTLGDYVRQGETIARIESADAAALAAQLSAARARVNELSAAYDRERRLFEANVTARQDLEAARAHRERLAPLLLQLGRVQHVLDRLQRPRVRRP